MSSRPSRFLLSVPAVLALVVLTASTASGAEVWTRIGPEGGDVLALAAAPSRPATLYAGLRAGGVYRSVDAGVTWAFAGAGLGRFTAVVALAVDARLPKTIYAATTAGLFKSADAGVSWAPVALGGSGPQFATAVAADPQLSGVVYLALSDEGLRKTTDGGHTWSTLAAGPPDTTLVLAIDPTHTATLYAGTNGQGVFKSTDGGAHWSAVNRGLPAPLPQIAALAVDPRSSRTLFVAPSNGKLFKSLDAGSHWTESDGGTGGLGTLFVRDVAIDPATSAVVYAATSSSGVYRSTDGGHSWHAENAGLSSLEANPLLANRWGLFAGTQGGVAASRDRALTWQSGTGVSATSISSLAVDSQNPPRLYALDLARGLFKSASGGAAWLRLPVPSGPDFIAVGPLVVDSHDPLTVDLGFIGSVGQSDNGGRRWSPIFPVGCVYPSRIVLDPSDPEVAYASGGFAIGECGLLPGACDSYKHDHGQTTCLRDAAISPIGMPVLALDPAAPAHLFASWSGGLYRSLDAGASWSLLSAAVQPFSLVFDAAHPGTLYAAVSPGGIARSADGGVTWQVSTAGLPAQTPMGTLVVDPVLPSTLYAASASAVYVSTDSAATWAPLGTGLEDVTLTGLVLDPVDPTILYVGTSGGGVMKLQR